MKWRYSVERGYGGRRLKCHRNEAVSLAADQTSSSNFGIVVGVIVRATTTSIAPKHHAVQV